MKGFDPTWIELKEGHIKEPVIGFVSSPKLINLSSEKILKELEILPATMLKLEET